MENAGVFKAAEYYDIPVITICLLHKKMMAKTQDWSNFQLLEDKELFAFMAFYKHGKE